MSTQPRKALLVLGMHRSGTSALTGMLARLGAALPRCPMPASADNPHGYGESRRIAQFNSRLLESAGTRWNDAGLVSEEWMAAGARGADRAEARALLEREFDASATMVLKDPRICRLVPFWRQVLAEAEIKAAALLMIRDPLEVAASLAVRAAIPEFRPAAVRSASSALLLWLRYVLAAERDTREMERWVMDYGDLITHWRETVLPVLRSGWLPYPAPATAAEIGTFLNPELRRQRSSAPLPAGVTHALAQWIRSVRDWPLEEGNGQWPHLDQLGAALDRLTLAYAPLRADSDSLAERDPWSERILAELASRPATVTPRRLQPTVVFLSGSPRSVGHLYRVVHPATALDQQGWKTVIANLQEATALDLVERADLVVVFRAPWDPRLEAVRARCTSQCIPLAYDIDDLLFAPAVTAAGHIAYLDGQDEAARRRWIRDAADYRQALARCDAAVLTTAPLARAADVNCARTFVLANALAPWMETAAEAAMAVTKASQADGRTRFLFASGTPSHHRDLASATTGLARVFARHPEPRLVVMGPLEVQRCQELLPFADRIEWWPAVPFRQLFDRLSLCDVNLCPLEPANPFCDSKSAVRWLAAASVGLPSIVSPSPPLRDAVMDGVSGWLAADADGWEHALEDLLRDAPRRRAMGQAARLDALARFGFSAWAPRVMEVYTTILNGGT